MLAVNWRKIGISQIELRVCSTSIYLIRVIIIMTAIIVHTYLGTLLFAFA